VTRVTQELLDRKVYRESKERPEPLEQPDQLEHKEFKVRLEPQVLLVTQERKAYKV
jgi:hypothetical protein